mmetsp:Transcript_21487/g.45428  ORF Transcript_21487/g.45428 Transcript_21487/m.45428 type:complete len:137 (+) Transcript_21487:888-1298(+)
MDLETRCWDTVVSQSLQSYESLKSRFYTKFLSLHAHRSRRIQLALDRAAAKAERGHDIADVPGNVDVVPLGFMTNMADWIVAADVLVSKAGPGTIAEAATVGLVLMHEKMSEHFGSIVKERCTQHERDISSTFFRG